jgi:hypothetical protein
MGPSVVTDAFVSLARIIWRNLDQKVFAPLKIQELLHKRPDAFDEKKVL